MLSTIGAVLKVTAMVAGLSLAWESASRFSLRLGFVGPVTRRALLGKNRMGKPFQVDAVRPYMMKTDCRGRLSTGRLVISGIDF